MSARHGQELALALGEGDVQAAFPLPQTVEQELETKGGFARPGPALDEVSAVGGVAAGQDVVEEPRLRLGQRLRRRWPAWLALPGGSDV
jgi:hypothetical protein